MKVTLTAFTFFFTLALCQKSTFLCRDVSNKVIEDGGICSGSGGKPLGKGICCIAKSDALARSKFDIACDDKLGTTQDTGEACEA
ncbi:uncharacterized protein CTRU02_204839 [Colletotrichum truncatum]|uniref:Uncharacterized protein n=1 Tax=Colletotrichum truncatum TaxID=5467 RepID=A0ACC3ZD99_COLTU|nr:uncharacterized protein CTRU02_03074 [Colletotrichum truncatum]KAF6798032.1 hypothetical protein CTRU02_03074 [Colletotrichum truncatum]